MTTKSAPSAASITAARAALSSPTLLPVLDGFAHRNKNQHRASHWWRHLASLRRVLRALTTGAQPYRGDDIAAFAQRAGWLRGHLLPRAYISFTQLAADNQYAPLGLALLAVLARVLAIVTELLPPPAPTDPTPLSAPQRNPSKAAEAVSSSNVDTDTSRIDRGVAIARDSAATPTNTASPDTIRAGSKRPARDSPARDDVDDKDRKAKKNKNKKKSKSKGDGFASLFGSLT